MGAVALSMNRRVLFTDVCTTRALLVDVYNRAPEFLEILILDMAMSSKYTAGANALKLMLTTPRSGAAPARQRLEGRVSTRLEIVDKPLQHGSLHYG